MEKNEINISVEGMELNFYFEDDLLPFPIDQFQKWLSLGVTILTKNFKLDSKTLVFNLTLIDDEQMKEINYEHRQKNKTTDVLSFPMQEDMRAGEYDSFLPEIELGDILISKEVCARQAQEHKIDFFDEFIHLFFHGFLHLYGYDHELNSDEDNLMRGLESELVQNFSNQKNF